MALRERREAAEQEFRKSARELARANDDVKGLRVRTASVPGLPLLPWRLTAIHGPAAEQEHDTARLYKSLSCLCSSCQPSLSSSTDHCIFGSLTTDLPSSTSTLLLCQTDRQCQ